jgi:NADPH2:quinone reductase
MVAGGYVAREIECLAEDGRLVLIAVQGGVKSEFNAGLVLRKRLTVTGSTLQASASRVQGSHREGLEGQSLVADRIRAHQASDSQRVRCTGGGR